MMTFRTVKDALTTVLGAGAAGNYQLVGFQRQSKGASVVETLPYVAVYYQSGNFPQSGGSRSGEFIHEGSYKIEISVAQPARADLTVLTDPGATAGAYAAALAAAKESADLADQKLDEAFDDVFQVLMAADNLDLGLAEGVIASRWLNDFRKDNPNPQGQVVILTGSATYTCRMSETVTGLTGTPGTVIDTTVNVKDDPDNNAGVTVSLP